MEKQVNKMTVQRLLINLGITPKCNGYRYMATAITVKLSTRYRNMPMFKLYELTGCEHNVSGASVERGMRSAISRAYNSNKLLMINELYDFNIITECPTVSDFIMYLVEYLDSFYQYDDIVIC